jgi:hypothetical protein
MPEQQAAANLATPYMNNALGASVWIVGSWYNLVVLDLTRLGMAR